MRRAVDKAQKPLISLPEQTVGEVVGVSLWVRVTVPVARDPADGAVAVGLGLGVVLFFQGKGGEAEAERKAAEADAREAENRRRVRLRGHGSDRGRSRGRGRRGYRGESASEYSGVSYEPSS